MDVASPHNIMLMQVSEDEYAHALKAHEPVRVASFGFLAGEPNPPRDELDRPVYKLYVTIAKNSFVSEFRMAVDDFNNIRVWEFMRVPHATIPTIAGRKKRAS